MTSSRPRPHRRAGQHRDVSSRALRATVAGVLAVLAVGTLAPTAGAAQPTPAPASSGTATGTLTGTLVRAYVERGRLERGEHLPVSRTPGADHLAWVETGSGQQVRVPSSQVVDVPAGARVRLTVGARRPGPDSAPTAGREVLATTVTSTPPGPASTTQAASGTPRAAGAARAAATVGPTVQQITLVQAMPSRGGGSYAADETTTRELAAEVAKASAFWSRQTGGRVTLKVVKAVGWTRLAATCDDPDQLWAEAAKKVGWTEAMGRHLLVQLPEAADTGGCGAGLGTVGRYLGDGGTTWTSYADWAVIAHELGHNFSLGHANALNCGSAADRLLGCTEQGYEDAYDVMGISWWNTGSLSTAHLDELGLMTSSTQRDVTRSVSAAADLRPVGGHQGLQSLTFVDRGVRYWVEYRGAIGYDAWTRRTALNAGYTPGVLVRRAGSATNPLSSYYDSRVLLRPRGMPRSASSAPQWTLTAGQAMETAGHRVIRVTRVSATSAQVLVEGSAPLTSVRTVAYTSGQRVGGTAYHKSSSLTVAFAASPRTPSKGFEILVDGRTRATAAPTARFARVTGLTSGSHTVAVRAVDPSRTVTSTATRIRVDRTPPTFSTKPTLRLRKGDVGDGVPLVMRYAASDGVRLAGLTASSGQELRPTSRSLALTQRPGTTVSRKLTAKDAAGNSRTATWRTKVRLISERKSTRYAGPWAVQRGQGGLGGQALRSRSRGASATLTTTGRDIGLVAFTGPTQGRVRVYVDGRRAGTVDLRTMDKSTRHVVWTHAFSRNGRHTVRLVVEGTAGRPWVSLDGWTALA
ncbi:MAG TPA: hypothetical protein VKB14_07670 [Actinomycetales bacterium]|nr:hypothetical protein [Actinomycetales bacterium]